MKAMIRQTLLIAPLLGMLCNAAYPVPKEEGGIAAIKAVYVYHFASFTRWPGEAKEPPQREVRLCVLGGGEVSVGLLKLDGKDLEERRLLRVAPVRSEQITKACHMVFLGDATGLPDNPAWAGLRGSPILWVSDQPGFAQQGGMIEMLVRDDKIKMRINLSAIRSAGLSLSSKLLRLAEIVDAP